MKKKKKKNDNKNREWDGEKNVKYDHFKCRNVINQTIRLERCLKFQSHCLSFYWFQDYILIIQRHFFFNPSPYPSFFLSFFFYRSPQIHHFSFTLPPLFSLTLKHAQFSSFHPIINKITCTLTSSFFFTSLRIELLLKLFYVSGFNVGSEYQGGMGNENS